MKRRHARLLLPIVVVLAFASAARAQVAPTPEQKQFITVLVNRIRSKSPDEVTALQRQRLQPAMTAEQQAERDRDGLSTQYVGLVGRIDCLNWMITRLRGRTDAPTVQLVNALRLEAFQLNQQLRTVNAQLNRANTALNNAREVRLAAERIVASKQGTNIQQLGDLEYLYDAVRATPPTFSWQAMMDRVTAIAREKQLVSNLTIATGATPVTVRYQLVGSTQVLTAANCRQCSVRLPVGNYNFWVDCASPTGPQRRAYLIYGESQTIQVQTSL